MSLSNGIIMVQKRKYIVGSIDKDGYFSISSRPVAHDTLSSATAECSRLATATPGKAYVAMQLSGGAYLPYITAPASF